MTNTLPTAATTTESTPCLCGLFEAMDSEQLTEADLETGDYDSWYTGCTETTQNTFAPGHDAKLKSALIRWGSQDLEVSQLVGGVRVTASAEQWADKLEFGYMVRAGIDRAVTKAAAREAKRQLRMATAAARAEAKANKAERKLAEKAGLVAASEPQVVEAKVGRWTYTGVIEGDEFVYTGKSADDVKRTRKFTLI